MADQQCLVIIKPDGLVKSITGNIITVLSEAKLKIVGAKMKYKFIFSLDVGKLIPQAGKIIDSVNETMHSFGFPETLCVRSEALEFIAETEKELTVTERNKLIQTILDNLKNSEKFKSWNIRFERIERY